MEISAIDVREIVHIALLDIGVRRRRVTGEGEGEHAQAEQQQPEEEQWNNETYTQ